MQFVAVFVISFLLGSVPWGLVISKVFYKKDLREVGSGNIGTTNAIRAMGKVGGYAVFVLDFGKGLLSGFIGLWIAQAAGFDQALVGISTSVAFFGCVYGHIFSPWLKFKGGKGIAVAIGCLFVTFGPIPAIIELAIFAVLVATTKYVSVGSMAAALACPLLSLWVFWGNWIAVLFCSITGLTVFWAHRGNLARLREGTENRIGSKKKQGN
ncbi:MAG: glycerol-3-phosphate 1-O-acyltransferase PlsY [Eggerthellaceae bacterium]|nr:glycerol-3-phosphate 1-O-acyltransferase PlsY [Eggerthellaceae bacterium]